MAVSSRSRRRRTRHLALDVGAHLLALAREFEEGVEVGDEGCDLASSPPRSRRLRSCITFWLFREFQKSGGDLIFRSFF
jgi:hypothetical protein